MQLLYKSRDRHAQRLRDWALSRTKLVLRRMAWRVSQASVQMTDVDGPRHGVDKRCQVSLVATDGAPVVVTATARDWRTALNQALARAIEVLKRLFDRTLHARRAERLFIRDGREAASSRTPA